MIYWKLIFFLFWIDIKPALRRWGKDGEQSVKICFCCFVITQVQKSKLAKKWICCLEPNLWFCLLVYNLAVQLQSYSAACLPLKMQVRVVWNVLHNSNCPLQHEWWACGAVCISGWAGNQHHVAWWPAMVRPVGKHRSPLHQAQYVTLLLWVTTYSQ